MSMLDSTNIASAPRVYGGRRRSLCVCVVIRAEFIFQVHEIIIRTCYVNSVKSTELHMNRGLKYKGKGGKLDLLGAIK